MKKKILLVEDEEGLRKIFSDESVICFAVLDNDRVIANTFLNKLENITEELFDGYWDPSTYTTYGENNTYYANSVAVLPEYRNKGLAYKLKEKSLNYLKNKGVKYVIGHAHEGNMFNINKKFGAVVVKELVNWMDSGETHYLYQIEL